MQEAYMKARVDDVDVEELGGQVKARCNHWPWQV